MKRSHVFLGAFVLALLVASGWLLFPKLFRKVTEDIPLPPTGEAAYNPLYGLKLALLAHGEKVSAWPNLPSAMNQLGAHDTLVLYDRPEAMSQPQAQRLLEWVNAGGFLLMPGPASGVSPGPLAGALGLRGVEPPPAAMANKPAMGRDQYAGCDRMLAGNASRPARDDEGVWLCDPRFRPLLPGFALSGGDDKRGWRFARRTLGAGVVTVVELDYLDNEGLRDPAARALAFQLLAPGLGRGRMQLVYSADVPSLLRLLVDYAWMVLLPLLLALLAWLSFRSQRFGPLQPAPEPRRRALLEHVRAAGEFAWSRQRMAALHAAVLRLLRQRLQRRAPEIFALSGAAQEQALAEATSLPLARVRETLNAQGLAHPNVFTTSISTLLQMRSRL
jgi:hypothetical protein